MIAKKMVAGAGSGDTYGTHADAGAGDGAGELKAFALSEDAAGAEEMAEDDPDEDETADDDP